MVGRARFVMTKHAHSKVIVITKSYPISENRKRKPYLHQLGAASIGIEMGVSVVIGYLLGSWLDGKADSKPWFTMGCLLLGIAAGFFSLYKHARRTLAELKSDASEESNESHTQGNGNE